MFSLKTSCAWLFSVQILENKTPQMAVIEGYGREEGLLLFLQFLQWNLSSQN